MIVEKTGLIRNTGLCAGLAVSTFSKPLTLLIGLMVVGLQVNSLLRLHHIEY